MQEDQINNKLYFWLIFIYTEIYLLKYQRIDA